MRATAGRNTRRIGGWAKRRSSTSKGGSVPPVSMQIATSMVGTAQLRLCATLRNWIALRAREGNADAESAADRWPHRACHWPPLDRSGSGCNQLAAIELHDPADAVGRLRRGTGRARVDPDLAEQAVGRRGEFVIAGLDPAIHRLLKKDGCADQVRA